MKRACSIAIALSVSLFIYLFYRSEKTVVNELFILIFSPDTYVALKKAVVRALPMNATVVFSLPGGLWVFCATVLARDFYVKSGHHKIQIVVIPLIFAIGLEFCQLFQITNGRFDLLDIAFFLMFWFLAYYSFQSTSSQQKILTPFTLHGFICLACFFSVYLAHVSQ